jgi:hypothetical protein
MGSLSWHHFVQILCTRENPQPDFALNFIKTTCIDACLLYKTLALRSFQISQDVSMMSDAKDFRILPFMNTKRSHQSSTVSKLDQVEVLTEMIPSQESKEFQILVKRRCAADSGSLLHNWQTPQLVHPHFWSRSVVQTQSGNTSHAKCLHLGGAQLFHTASGIWEKVMPSNWALYADASV